MRYNIQLGLFGHQHRAKVLQSYSDVTEEKEMLLVSTGCLYGNVKQMPPGTSRHYNLITVNMQGLDVVVEVRTRKDKSEGLYQIPIWEAGKIGNSEREVVSKTIRLNAPVAQPLEKTINEIDERIRKNGDYKVGIQELKALRDSNPIVEKYLDDYIDFLKPEDCYDVKDMLGEIRTDKQAMYLLGAAKTLRDKDLLSQLKQIDYIKNSVTPSVRILRDE